MISTTIVALGLKTIIWVVSYIYRKCPNIVALGQKTILWVISYDIYHHCLNIVALGQKTINNYLDSLLWYLPPLS